MDRRFLTWLMLTTALCLLYLSMRPQVPQNPPEPPASATMDPLASSESDISDTKDAEPGTSQVSESTKPEFASRRTTLGSMNPELKYNLLVTLSSRGASLERVELVEQKSPGKFRYRALETDSGYLGHLALDPELRITTVPDGSPAALARVSGASGGLEIGDKLTQVNGMELTRPESLELALQKTKPGDEISCRVERQNDGVSQTLEFATVLTETPLD
ncbi:MAG: PDZ domain-containing protein, partial [bacterium]|nr:PDZ domain-containing protein [bacterium]